MRHDPPWKGALAERADEQSQSRLFSAVIHRTPDALEKFVERSRRLAKHLYLLARFGEMRRQQNVVTSRHFLAAAIQISRSSKQCVRREAPTGGLLQRLDCSVNKFICTLRRTDIDQFRKPPGANGRPKLRNQIRKSGQIRNRGCPKSFRLLETIVN